MSAIDSREIEVDAKRGSELPADGTPEYEALLDAIDDALEMGMRALAESLHEKFPDLEIRVEGVPMEFS
jgi:hypothetical protein